MTTTITIESLLDQLHTTQQRDFAHVLAHSLDPKIEPRFAS